MSDVKVKFRISPIYWPLIFLFSPILIPILIIKHLKFKKNTEISKEFNIKSLHSMQKIEIPEVESLELRVLVEEKVKDGFKGDAAISYLFKTNMGTLLFDVGFGAERPAFDFNSKKLGVSIKDVDSLMISHLHPDHMGGLKASRNKHVSITKDFGYPEGRICYLPEEANANGFDCSIVNSPMILESGIVTTGPLSRALFFMGLTMEQAIVINVKDKGLVVFTGCGHPTIELIIKAVKRISDIPIYAIGGGLHFPVSRSRGAMFGIEIQTLIGTGKSIFNRLKSKDLNKTISEIQKIAPSRVMLSGHDSCDYSLNRLKNELNSETIILEAGALYKF